MSENLSWLQDQDHWVWHITEEGKDTPACGETVNNPTRAETISGPDLWRCMPCHDALGLVMPEAPPTQPEPIALRAATLDPVPEVVALLEEALAMAKEGRIIGVAIASAVKGQCDASSFELGAATTAQLYLGMARCQRRLMDWRGE